jgi:hypothetical protein
LVTGGEGCGKMGLLVGGRHRLWSPLNVYGRADNKE